MLPKNLLIAAHFLAASAQAEPLLAVLQANGLTGFAQLLQKNPPPTTGRNIIVYAPTNPALTAAGALTGNGTTLSRRDEDHDRWIALCMANQNAVVLKRDVLSSCSPGSVFETLLSGPEWVNLGPGRNQSLVEKGVSFSSRPLVLTGLGASIKVVASDIAFDGGVVRPVDGIPTLPRSLSYTLPFLNADAFGNALRTAGLLPGLDNRTSITVLAPNNAAFRNNGGLTGARLEQVLKEHILLGFPAYTPLLKDGSTYRTLAGSSVTVSVRDGVAYIGGAQILAGDSIIQNGVVHTVDKLLTTTASSTALPVPVPTAAATTAKPLSWQALAFTLIGMAVAARCRFL
ncbi:hypothetical protein GGTG_12134 [Gaeumannomyces tritici R3-111a-1]|uniref:FAS1 domain-containing protein n=1 Tax=Gaeumannomyces tritici (strain R3-111a-1) TaxID=644352 RepID=J3PF55_GAET3|nr:hypothetical protein GGTG_12134 [Gaeumannomyces tritici R3-111a-1]EJT69957.1 hypothetical protein GGTG_12134 [Gaeumannomyces tritici R3-111a-1]